MNTNAMRAHWSNRPRPPRTPMLAVVPPAVEELIVQVAAQHCRVSLAVLLSGSRRRPAVHARRVAMLVLADGLGWRVTEIAAWFDRDPSTVSWALEVAESEQGAAIQRDAAHVRLLVDERLQAHGVR